MPQPENLVAIIEEQVAQAIGHWDGQLSEDRATEFNYYYGRPFGNEVEGESQVVSTDVADTIEGILPSILRIFTSSDDAVRFDPNGPEDEEMAAQQTEVANYIFYRQNNGFLVLYEWFKDALMQKNGIVKYWWEDHKERTKESYQGLTDGEYKMLLSGDGLSEIEELEHSSYDDPQAVEQRNTMITQMTAQMQQPMPIMQQNQMQQQLDQLLAMPIPQLHDVTVRIIKDASRLCIKCIPPEEFGISAKHHCVSIQDTPFCYHRGRMTISELREMGCPEDILTTLGSNDTQDMSPEALARDRFIDLQWPGVVPPADPSMKEVWVTECFIRLDEDGDGVAELRHIIMPGREIWIDEETDHINFAAITPIIMPHRWVGRSVSELVMDIQFTKSVIWRQMLNNLYLTNNPRKAVLSSAGGIVQANLDDLLTSRPGGIMREYVPGAIRNEEVPFVAGASFPMLEYMDSLKENRTGNTRYNQGTDADSLNKMLDIHTEVPLADGSFKLLRDVVDGDKLIGADGNAVTVLKAHEIHNPVKAYRMVFASGDEVVAGGEHLWTIKTERDKLSGISRTVDTDTVYKRTQDFAENVYIPRLQRPKFGGGSLPINPYLLGCWLGDGTSAKSAITTMDTEIHDAFVNDGWIMYADKHQNAGLATTWCISSGEASVVQEASTGRMVSTGKGWLGKLHALGINGVKHIPEEYQLASYEDRLELLRGLMDTDGCHHSGALVIFSQKGGKLLSDVVRLIEGLGGWPSLSHQNRPETGKDGETYWNVTFHIFDNPFRIKRKADKWRAPIRNAETQPIVSVEPVAIRPMRCLTVDAQDGLFCVGRRYTITHNTARGIQIIQSAGQQRLDLIARIFAETGVKDLMRGIVYMMGKYSVKPLTLKLRNKWVDVDPREWKTMLNMTINVGLGTGNRDIQLAHLTVMDQKQKELMATGKGYMVSDENVYNLYKKTTEAMGFKHPELFVTDPSKIPPEAKQPATNPDILKLQQEAQSDQQKNQISMQKEQMGNQTLLAVEQIKAEAARQVAAIEAASKKEIEAMRIRADAELALYKQTNSVDGAKQDVQHAIKQRQIEEQAAIERMNIAIEAAIKDVTNMVSNYETNMLAQFAKAEAKQVAKANAKGNAKMDDELDDDEENKNMQAMHNELMTKVSSVIDALNSNRIQ